MNSSHNGGSARIRIRQAQTFGLEDGTAAPILAGIPFHSSWVNKILPLLLLVATAITLWGATQHRSYLNDDTYITLTYARSLAAGEGWRYNGGTEALGTTTPLFALVVAALSWLFPSIPLEWFAVGFSTLCWLGTGWFFFLGHRDFGLNLRAGAILALVVLLQGGWLFGSLGMEAAFLLFGLTLAVWVAGRGYSLLAGLVGALLFLVRPEGLAMVPLVGAWILWHRRDALPRFATGALLPLCLWVSYAWMHFSSILPNSALAKVGQGAFWPGKPFVERLFGEWLPAHAANYGFSPTLSLIWPLSLLGLLYVGRQRKALLLFVGWGAVFLAGYYLLGAPGYWWYMMPVLFLLQLFSGLGIIALVEQPQRGVK
ncbi:MAG: hypothetical protein H0T73_21775, partial [Ardenticatenales bacterium]|nr:hypothetical protein [Ardenticatenales bacterium]